MKKNILVLVFCLLCALLTAQERVAILPFTGGDAGEGDALAQLLGTEFTKLVNFQIVPRTAAINKVMEEHKFQRGGLTDGDTIVALGKGVNAKYVVSGHIQNLGNRKMIAASILHVETFQQVAGDYYEYEKLEDVISYLPTLTEKLVSRTKKNYSDLPTLAILPFAGVDENSADVLAQLLAIELTNGGKYAVISRTSTIKNAMEEQNIQRSGLTDESTMAKLGKVINAKYVLSGSVLNIGAADLMNVTIIEVLSLVQAGGDYIQYETIEEGMELMPQLAYKLTGVLSLKVAIEIYEGKKGIKAIKKLISKGINTRGYGDYTPLMNASLYGYTEIVKALIVAGADLNAKNDKGWSALIFAAFNGHTEVVKELINAGANINIEGNDGNTALDDALDKGHIEIVNLLRKYGAR